MADSGYQLSSGLLDLALEADGNKLRLALINTPSYDWTAPANRSSLFAVYVNGRRYDAHRMAFLGADSIPDTQGVQHAILRFGARNFNVDYHLKFYERTALFESWPVIVNTGDKALQVGRMDAFSLDLQALHATLRYYTSGWGSEFEPQTATITKKIILQTRTGRSSHGQHPWFSLQPASEAVLSGSIAWSGNWAFRFEPTGAGDLRISGGMNPWGFKTSLQPGEQLESPPCILAFGADLDDTANQFSQVCRIYWLPANPFAGRLPVEWNHWWSYEDVDIDETVFMQNLEPAAQMGIEVCTLDAGWFGPNDSGTHWYDYRGDWAQVNQARFPHGIRPLAERAHALGMRFGLWCEIEGLGKRARLAETHPDFRAVRDGENLGYVCFGNPDVQAWAFETLRGLIRQHGCDWIKLDFNLDPGAGCSRTDHGHQEGDGLYAHYNGYYRTLERLRSAFPAVVLESCSSGGLRIDPGILRQTHMTFLSDPDWPVHDLQIFWGASTMIPPRACLHWSFGEWRNEDPPPQQNFNPRSPDLTRQQLDYYTRISMLGLFGFSQKLPDLPEWVAQRMVYHIQKYKQHVRHFIKDAYLYRLTSQPLRSGDGERWAAFQYSLSEQNEHLLFVFRLPGGEEKRQLQLRGLQGGTRYLIEDLDGETIAVKTGDELMAEGIVFQDLREEDSALLRIRPVD